MKKYYIKTYAAKGLIEWQMVLNAAGAFLRICFSGGSMGSNGVIPAKYTTDNPAIQAMIEKTPHFKCGRIIVYHIKAVDIPEPDKPEKENAVQSTLQEGEYDPTVYFVPPVPKSSQNDEEES